MPLHSTRLRERGFNQCQELARPLSDALGVPLVPDLLLRQHPTRHQVGLSEAERVANLKSAFLSLPEVRGKRILLVDDTYTTGTTLRRAALKEQHENRPPRSYRAIFQQLKALEEEKTTSEA